MCWWSQARRSLHSEKPALLYLYVEPLFVRHTQQQAHGSLTIIPTPPHHAYRQHSINVLHLSWTRPAPPSSCTPLYCTLGTHVLTSTVTCCAKHDRHHQKVLYTRKTNLFAKRKHRQATPGIWTCQTCRSLTPLLLRTFDPRSKGGSLRESRRWWVTTATPQTTRL